ncbi:MAG: PEP-CTERM sorting domain-containing protein [Phycisphaerae bacterium]
MRRFRALGLGLSIVVGMAAQAQAGLLYSVPAFSHPNGEVSANPLAVDSRDYGLRLDDGSTQTFAFVDVKMDFFTPDAAPNQGTVYARLHGTIAHLQSSNGVILGYSGSSGLDALDQRWNLEATFRVISRTGTFGGGASVPYPNMLLDLKNAGISSSSIRFALHDLTLTPNFGGTKIYGGPTVFDERPGSDASPSADAFILSYRDRLTDPAFSGSQWNVIAAAGWLEPAQDQPNGTKTRDYLFYLGGVPEPATLGLLAMGLPILWPGRRRK